MIDNTKQKKIYILTLSVISIIIILCLVFKYYKTISCGDELSYVKQTSNGFFVEKEVLDYFKEPHIYTTLFMNKFKKILNKEDKNLNIRNLKDYNLNDITLIKQCIESDISFTDDEIQMF